MPLGALVFFLHSLDEVDPLFKYSSDAENSRSASFDWQNCIQTGLKFEILVLISLFGLALFVKFLILTCLLKRISASLIFIFISGRSKF